MIKTYYRNYINYRQTFTELSRLNDRELSDIGISRSDIPAIARQSVRKSV